ncbi:hypothetical protein BDK51DRAFT_48152 [Blyttiomyces helicus]|uniref:Uncharacterized protein n=1 Tax=Blyttiomyces helicus TaxID=388810 RepID=A0A4P9W480_9FUNG|nr:hypothetical protein BDK51DRAFT_48152 [Blyttiomyces helicus]|eukprot:RKO85480.1 hypothetical protein BDK51DRAFT_48152 [Blyttiomyces helicus]
MELDGVAWGGSDGGDGADVEPLAVMILAPAGKHVYDTWVPGPRTQVDLSTRFRRGLHHIDAFLPAWTLCFDSGDDGGCPGSESRAEGEKRLPGGIGLRLGTSSPTGTGNAATNGQEGGETRELTQGSRAAGATSTKRNTASAKSAAGKVMEQQGYDLTAKALPDARQNGKPLIKYQQDTKCGAP